jgi:replicative DNA helicase
MQTPTYAEAAVLGGILVRNENFHDAAPLLSADHFTTAFHRRLWNALRDRILAGEAADSVTIAELLPEDALSVIDLANTTVTGRTVPTYVAIVRENWQRREASAIAQRLLASMRDGEKGAVDEAIGALLNLNAAQSEHDFTGKQALLAAWKQVQAAYESGGKLPGITTGLEALDDILGGWHDSDLTIIGARPAMGKTALAIGLAEAAAASGKVTGMVSAEQPYEQIGMRRLALAGNYSASHLRAGRVADEAWGMLNAGLKRNGDLPLRIYDRSAVTLDELVGVGRKWKHSHGLQILFIDYAQRITVPGADRITEVATVARGLKNLARDLQIPVIALAQVKAAVEQRTDRRPNAGDLANSDELTREADQVLMLYRDEVYNPDSPDRGIAEILIEKNRHGPVGFKKVAFLGETMRFADLAPEAF